MSNYFPCSRQPNNQPNMNQMMPGMQMPAQQGGMPLFPLPSIGTTLPTGIPLGPAITGTTPAPSFVPTDNQPSQTLQSTQFTPGFLRTQIGKKVKIEFLIGTNSTTDRTGTLVGVGTSFVLLRLEESDDIQLADIYSIRFVTFFL